MSWSISEVDGIKGRCLSLPVCFLSTLLVGSRSHNRHFVPTPPPRKASFTELELNNMVVRLHKTTVHVPVTILDTRDGLTQLLAVLSGLTM